MTGPRVQIPTISPEARRPRAQPVDSFVRPATSGSFKRIAESLAGIAPQLSGIADLLGRRRSEGELSKGRREARDIAAEGLSFRQAINKGRITADQSPFFRVGVEEQFGRITADKFYAAMLTELDQNEALRESTDPADFEKWVGGFRNQFLLDSVGEEVSGAFDQGFGARAEAHIQNTRLAFASRAGSQLISQSKEQTFTELVGVIENNLLLGDEVSDEEFINDIQLTMDRALAIGMSGREVNSIVSRVVTNIAIDQDNLQLLDVLDKLPTPGGIVGNREETIELVRDARDRIFRQRRTERSDEATSRAHAEVTRNEASIIQLTDQFMRGEVDIEELARDNPTYATQLQQQHATLQEMRFGSDEGVVQSLLTRIDLFGPDDDYYVSKFTLAGMAQAGLLDKQDYITLSNRLQRRDVTRAEAAEGEDPNLDPAFKFYQRMMDSFFGRDVQTQQYPPAMADAAIMAQARFREANIAFLSSEKGRTMHAEDPGAYNKWLHDTMREIAHPLRGEFATEWNAETVSSFGQLERTPEWVNNQAVSEEAWRRLSTEWYEAAFADDPFNTENTSDDTMAVMNALGIRDNAELIRFLRAQQFFFPGFGLAEDEEEAGAGPSETQTAAPAVPEGAAGSF